MEFSGPCTKKKQWQHILILFKCNNICFVVETKDLPFQALFYIITSISPIQLQFQQIYVYDALIPCVWRVGVVQSYCKDLESCEATALLCPGDQGSAFTCCSVASSCQGINLSRHAKAECKGRILHTS